MDTITYGVCIDGAAVDEVSDADVALAKARELKAADPDATISIVLWAEEPKS